MKKTIEVTETKTEMKVVAVQCDKCKKEFLIRDGNDESVEEDIYEIQEFHFIDFIGGYASVFGDGNNVKCDLCQKCLYKLISRYMRIERVW